MMDRFWDCMAWLLSPEYRQMGRDIEEEFRNLDEHGRRLAEMDKRIEALFTPDEWAETRDRCERKLADLPDCTRNGC